MKRGPADRPRREEADLRQPSVRAAQGSWLLRRGLFSSRGHDPDAGGLRYREKFGDPFSSHSLIWRRLEQEGLVGKRVLELGVGDASLTKRLKEAGAIVDVVDVEPRSVDLARPYCRRTFSGDANGIETLGIGGGYDIVVAADVLEHLVDPETVLANLKAFLGEGGLLLVSLPNVANIHVRLNLLAGRFPYRMRGILDRSHLHFYTYDSARRLLRETGWVVEKSEVTVVPLLLVFPRLGRLPLKSLLLGLLHLGTRGMKRLLAYQTIWHCRAPRRPGRLP